MGYTWLKIKSRVAALMGESSTTSDLQSHLNAAVQDICNSYNFSWDVKTTTGTLTAGVFNLATDFNPQWGLLDARIVASSDNDDNIFKQIDISDRDSYSSGDYVYWITYDTSNKVHVFNSLTQTGTVTYYYQFSPADMSADADVCVVPDGEAVAYLGASKMWIGDERNAQLKEDYEQEAAGRIRAMYIHDLAFGARLSLPSPVVDNPVLRGK